MNETLHKEFIKTLVENVGTVPGNIVHMDKNSELEDFYNTVAAYGTRNFLPPFNMNETSSFYISYEDVTYEVGAIVKPIKNGYYIRRADENIQSFIIPYENITENKLLEDTEEIANHIYELGQLGIVVTNYVRVPELLQSSKQFKK